MRVEYLGNGNLEELEARVQRVASAGKISRTSGKAYEVYQKCGEFDLDGYNRAVKRAIANGQSEDSVYRERFTAYNSDLRFAKRVIGMGHGSIAEHDYIFLSIDDVTPVVEHTLIGSRLASFTIKSRREVDFRTNGFYVPDFRDKDGNLHKDNDKLKEIYINHMQNLFNEYGNLVDSGIKLEDARYVLPYCFNSNIFMGMDARSFVKLTKYLLYGKASNITELKSLGDEFLKIIDEKIPYMSDEVRKKPSSNDDSFSYLDSFVRETGVSFDNKIHDKVSLVNYPSNSDDIVLASALQERYQLSQDKASLMLEECSKEDPSFKEKLMKVIFSNDEQRELEQVNFKFDIPISLAVRTHLERHRMQSLITPDFVPLWSLDNYDVPTGLTEEQKASYNELFKRNKEMRDYFLALGVNENDLVYFYQAANKCNVLTNINARSLAWISRMRCCNKAQFAIRKIANQMCGEVKEVSPLIGSNLGATCDVFGYCNEGKESCGKILAKRRKES